jgi:hypothetical protein
MGEPVNPIDPIAVERNAALDRVLRADPEQITDADLDHVIAKMRQERTLFIVSDEDKKGRKRAKASGEDAGDDGADPPPE